MNVTMWFIYKFREFIITVTCKQITILVKGKWGEDFIVIENTLSIYLIIWLVKADVTLLLYNSGYD